MPRASRPRAARARRPSAPPGSPGRRSCRGGRPSRRMAGTPALPTLEADLHAFQEAVALALRLDLGVLRERQVHETALPRRQRRQQLRAAASGGLPRPTCGRAPRALPCGARGSRPRPASGAPGRPRRLAAMRPTRTSRPVSPSPLLASSGSTSSPISSKRSSSPGGLAAPDLDEQPRRRKQLGQRRFDQRDGFRVGRAGQRPSPRARSRGPASPRLRTPPRPPRPLRAPAPASRLPPPASCSSTSISTTRPPQNDFSSRMTTYGNDPRRAFRGRARPLRWLPRASWLRISWVLLRPTPSPASGPCALAGGAGSSSFTIRFITSCCTIVSRLENSQ